MEGISSGRTEEVNNNTWAFDTLYEEPDNEIWEDQNGLESELLKRIKPFPRFFLYLTRYLISQHGLGIDAEEGLRQALHFCQCFAGDRTCSLDAVSGDFPDLFQIINIIMDDFRDNGLLINEKSIKWPDEVPHSLSPGNIQLSKEELIFRLCEYDPWSQEPWYSDSVKRIKTGEVFILACGLNMTRDTFSSFLSDVLLRRELNPLDADEMLYDLTLRLSNNRYRIDFYKKIKKYYEAQLEQLNTYMVEERETSQLTDDISKYIASVAEQCSSGDFAIDEEIPVPVKNFLDEYAKQQIILNKHRNSGDRIASDILMHIWKMLRKSNYLKDPTISGQIPEDNDKTAEGFITVSYDPRKGLDIPENTVFYKGTKEHYQGSFSTDEDIHISPVTRSTAKIEMDFDYVGYTVNADGTADLAHGECEKQTIFLPINPTLRNKIIDLHNKSKFKFTSKQKNHKHKSYPADNISGEVSYRTIRKNGTIEKSGKEATTKQIESYEAGKVTGEAAYGTVMKAGTEFYPLKYLEDFENSSNISNHEDILKQHRYILRDDVVVKSKINVNVKADVPNIAAEKNTIQDCNIDDWERKFEISNRKIGRQASFENKLTGFLYPDIKQNERQTPDHSNGKIASVLMGTKLPRRLIRDLMKNKICNITRQDLISLVFIEDAIQNWFEMGGDIDLEEDPLVFSDDFNTFIQTVSQRRGTKLKSSDISDAKIRGDLRKKFIEKCNVTLIKAHFRSLYYVNPYEDLLVLLSGSDDAIDLFRNCWEFTNAYIKSISKEVISYE